MWSAVLSFLSEEGANPMLGTIFCDEARLLPLGLWLSVHNGMQLEGRILT